MINKVIVLGGGSAGFLAAISLKAKIKDLSVTVIRSKDIGIIGVGEGSTVGLTGFLHKYLGVGHRQFFAVAQPTWKLGLRFIWGPRPHFHYNFVNSQLTGKVPGLPKIKAFYCDQEMQYEDPVSTLMSHDKAFERLPNGLPGLHGTLAYHFENDKFVRFLESLAGGIGVQVLDDTVLDVRRGEMGIAGLQLASGRTESADLYLDCSGFSSALLGKAMAEPFVSFKSSLYCDRAVVGGWERTDEPIKPYTTCQTMNSGWCWQIEHETRINRGYVYSSAFASDDEAEREFRAGNPKVTSTRIVKFVSGRYERSWVDNVVAIGNAYGFVEPLEATALGVIAVQSLLLTDSLIDSGGRVEPTHRRLYNRHIAQFWDNIRAFLAVHYKFNTRIDSPFWRHCLEHTDLAGAQEIVEVYQENGPTSFWAPSLIDPANQFGLSGYFAMLIGQKVPHRNAYSPSADELKAWADFTQKNDSMARQGLTVKESLAAVRSPNWQRPDDS
jgi:tryptophan 7-halogenase